MIVNLNTSINFVDEKIEFNAIITPNRYNRDENISVLSFTFTQSLADKIFQLTHELDKTHILNNFSEYFNKKISLNNIVNTQDFVKIFLHDILIKHNFFNKFFSTEDLFSELYNSLKIDNLNQVDILNLSFKTNNKKCLENSEIDERSFSNFFWDISDGLKFSSEKYNKITIQYSKFIKPVITPKQIAEEFSEAMFNTSNDDIQYIIVQKIIDKYLNYLDVNAFDINNKKSVLDFAKKYIDNHLEVDFIAELPNNLKFFGYPTCSHIPFYLNRFGKEKTEEYAKKIYFHVKYIGTYGRLEYEEILRSTVGEHAVVLSNMRCIIS